MMLKKSRVKFLESEIVTYPTTQMMRNLLVAQVFPPLLDFFSPFFFFYQESHLNVTHSALQKYSQMSFFTFCHITPINVGVFAVIVPLLPFLRGFLPIVLLIYQHLFPHKLYWTSLSMLEKTIPQHDAAIAVSHHTDSVSHTVFSSPRKPSVGFPGKFKNLNFL